MGLIILAALFIIYESVRRLLLHLPPANLDQGLALTALTIGINALLRRTRVTPEQLDLINTLGMSSEILLSLLDNVLDIAKIEAARRG